MRKKEIMFLIVLICIFAIILILSLINLRMGIALFEIGLSPAIINSIVLILSFVGIVKTLWHLVFNY